jgi:hypothetical protein
MPEAFLFKFGWVRAFEDGSLLSMFNDGSQLHYIQLGTIELLLVRLRIFLFSISPILIWILKTMSILA